MCCLCKTPNISYFPHNSKWRSRSLYQSKNGQQSANRPFTTRLLCRVSTEAAEWRPREQQQCPLFRCLCCKLFIWLLVFKRPSDCKMVFQKKQKKGKKEKNGCQNLVPGHMMKGGLAAGCKTTGRIMHCLSTHGLIPAGEWLYWAITASARKHFIVLLFCQRSSEGAPHNGFLLIFLVVSSNCMWLESWLLFSRQLP